MNNLTQQQRNDAERIARHLCHKKKAENDNVSGIALALLQTIGATRFKRAVLFQLKQITLGITGKAPGRDFCLEEKLVLESIALCKIFWKQHGLEW